MGHSCDAYTKHPNSTWNWISDGLSIKNQDAADRDRGPKRNITNIL
jgi:hypothetical protein